MVSKSSTSLIVPTFNSELFLENCLRSIREQTCKNAEVIVVDNYSTDRTKEIAKKYGADIIEIATERSKARNVGAEKAKSEFVFFVDSDMELSPKVTEKCIERIKKGYDVVIIPEISVGQGFWAGCKTLEKSLYLGNETIEAARFFRKSTFHSVGGYDSKLIAGEDWDLTERIRESGFKIGRVDSTIRHHEGRLSFRRVVGKKFEYGKTIRRYWRKHPHKAKKQLTPTRLLVCKTCKGRVEKPSLVFGLLLIKVVEFAAGGLGYLLSEFSHSE